MNLFRPVLAGILSLITVHAQVVINEIHYDPAVKTELAEFIELHNPGGTDRPLAGWRLTGSVEYDFPSNAVVSAGGYLVVAENPAAFARKFPGRTALGPWAGLLSNQGERVTLLNGGGAVTDTVEYQLGFPWPTVGDLPGYSIELIHPALDNDLGGSWRASVRGAPQANVTTLISAGAEWRFVKGTAEASNPTTAWRTAGFADAGWTAGRMPVGYDPNIAMNTPLADMRGNYTSVFLRRKFNVGNPASIATLRLEAMFDDGIKIWINGREVLSSGLPTTEVAFNATATGGARESANYEVFTIASPATVLQAGENIIAVQLHNVSLADSSDAYLDLALIGETGSASAGPTPGARNAVFDTNAPPQVRQVGHTPEQPRSGQDVLVTAKITDPDGVGPVELLYQSVDPGSYIELNDPGYATNWTPVRMRDDGSAGDLRAGDSVYSALLPASVQTHRRLVRYRIVAADTIGFGVRAPHLDDPQPNFAYFVHDGIPAWKGAARPGTTPVQEYSAEEMGRLPAYHLIAKKTSVETATWTSRYEGDLYRWWGTLVYNGKVYDHIRYRARGGVWRYAMGKNMWKFDFNRGHDFEPRDDYGRPYATKWRKLNLGANIQQGDYQHRGEQGMFESVGFRLFNLAGVESPKTHWATFRVVDEAAEASAASQFDGDFWGLYLAIEQEDGRFLEEHGLPDGNLYKMEGYNGELNNQGRYAATDKSDINAFTSAYRNGTPTEDWWRQNFSLDRYYSYQAIAQGIHHYDICYGKNYMYYLNPETRRWQVVTWDLDLTWADNMYDAGCGATDEFKNRITTRAPFSTEYKNRVRELRDLLFNNDEAWRLIDEHAAIVKGAGALNILGADRAMWDYHPVMNNSAIVNLSKAGHGRFYQFPLESANNPNLRGSFDAAVRIMKNYVVTRGAVLDGLAADAGIPARPSIAYEGPAGHPVNRLVFRSSQYSGGSAFAAMKWRIGEVRAPSGNDRAVYEIEPVWESPEGTRFDPLMTVPPNALRVGRTYRARVRVKDAAGRWSQWSAPAQFVAGEPDTAFDLLFNLSVSEIMYNPPGGSDLEYLELFNRSSDKTLTLDGAVFTEGIAFTFPTGATLAPRGRLLLIRGPETVFRAHYEVPANVKIFGAYSGALNNDGERITLKTAGGGQTIFTVAYRDRSGWPIAADGAGHSLVLTAAGNLDFGPLWRSSHWIGGSPGVEDSEPPSVLDSVLINEIAAHTDHTDPARPEYDSNDWIELVYSGSETLREHYLSDDPADLRKWRLPEIAGPFPLTRRFSFDEVTGFHNPITNGFGLDKAGEEVYLSHFPTAGKGRVVDAVRFKGQESGFSWGRHPDGGRFFYTLLPTRDGENQRAPLATVISEVMHHPAATNDLQEAGLEYVELHNPTAAAVALANTNGPFRLDGGIAFTFPTGVSLAPGGVLLVVGFNPAVAADRNRFLAAYSLQNSNVVILGPFTGRLDNRSDRVALEKPEAPDLPGAAISWVIVDETTYEGTTAAGDGRSLARRNAALTGNDPDNLPAGAPTPGHVPGITAPPQMAVSRAGNTAVIRFATEAGKTYSVEQRGDLGGGAWTALQEIVGGSPAEIRAPVSERQKFYRVTVRPAN